jgi:hypothetical protein
MRSVPQRRDGVIVLRWLCLLYDCRAILILITGFVSRLIRGSKDRAVPFLRRHPGSGGQDGTDPHFPKRSRNFMPGYYQLVARDGRQQPGSSHTKPAPAYCLLLTAYCLLGSDLPSRSCPALLPGRPFALAASYSTSWAFRRYRMRLERALG